MKEILFTVRDDICAQTGRDPNAIELIEAMKNYGTVEEFSSVENRVRQEYQKALDNLTAQYNAVKDQELSDSELKLIRTLRECKKVDEKTYTEKIAELENQLISIKQENEQRASRIKEILERG